MSDELRELYQEVIIDHGRRPRNFGALENATYQKEGFNPLCGDKITLYIREQNTILEKIQFEGCGCAISMASTSLMTEVLSGKTRQDAEDMFSAFYALVMKGESSEKLGKLSVLSGVSEFPARVKCATLAWHTLRAVLQNDPNKVTTEEDNL